MSIPATTMATLAGISTAAVVADGSAVKICGQLRCGKERPFDIPNDELTNYSFVKF